MVKLLFFYLQVANSILKNKKLLFELLFRKVKKHYLFSSYNYSRFLCWNDILYDSELFKKNIAMFDEIT